MSKCLATQVGQENKQRRRSSTSDQETYTVDTSKETRATSPDNTEYEISYMTDLPSEREGNIIICLKKYFSYLTPPS